MIEPDKRDEALPLLESARFSAAPENVDQIVAEFRLLALRVAEIRHFDPKFLAAFGLEQEWGNAVTRMDHELGFCAVEGGTLEQILALTSEQLAPWRELVQRIRDEVKTDPDYKALVDAYGRNDQRALAELVPWVLSSPSAASFLRGERLYHGVKIEGDDVNSHIDLILKIQKEGILPSPFGLHPSMTEEVRPVYSALAPLHAHGLAMLAFEPALTGHTVFSDWAGFFGAESLIYTPLLTGPFKLLLASEKLLYKRAEKGQRLVGESTGLDSPEAAREYRSRLEQALRERGIAFELVKG